FRIIESGIVAA
ncbi:unnamed protein product, partial [Brachionus calyciflorus]